MSWGESNRVASRGGVKASQFEESQIMLIWVEDKMFKKILSSGEMD